MIAILTDQNDFTTHKVIDWLNYRGKSCFILNENTKINFTYANINERDIILKNKGNTEISTKDIKAFWYRRYALDIGLETENTSNFYPPNYCNHITNDKKYLTAFTNYLLEAKKSIGRENTNYLSKLEQLYQAQEADLLIPPTYIVSTKKYLVKVLKKEKSLITKALQFPIQFIFKDNVVHSIMTELVSKEFLDNQVSDKFFPTLVQKNIEKKYELRIFFLNNKFYPMTIFSQNNEETKIDWRSGTQNLPNRNVPYKLPLEIEKKLIAFMNSIDLNSGSIDMMVTPNKEYYFLEVNPIGQFSQLSYMCNYFLEEEIALFLADN